MGCRLDSVELVTEAEVHMVGRPCPGIGGTGREDGLSSLPTQWGTQSPLRPAQGQAAGGLAVSCVPPAQT